MEIVFNGHANGKLLITGEYLVLCGAKALAVPTTFGQSMRVFEEPGPSFLHWKATLPNRSIWFEATFQLPTLKAITSTSAQEAELLSKLLTLSGFNFKKGHAYQIETQLEFDKNWGLGSSSTLIALLAECTQSDPFELLAQTFGGSGYDVAVAQAQKALLFQLNPKPQWETLAFNPSFADDLLFVYSGNKKISRDALKQFDAAHVSADTIEQLDKLTNEIILCNNLREFEFLLDQHEEIIGQALNEKPIKKAQFNDFEGSIKSLGAWGGDFFLATRKTQAKQYFSNKGYATMFEWKEIIK